MGTITNKYFISLFIFFCSYVFGFKLAEFGFPYIAQTIISIGILAFVFKPKFLTFQFVDFFVLASCVIIILQLAFIPMYAGAHRIFMGVLIFWIIGRSSSMKLTLLDMFQKNILLFSLLITIDLLLNAASHNFELLYYRNELLAHKEIYSVLYFLSFSILFIHLLNGRKKRKYFFLFFLFVVCDILWVQSKTSFVGSLFALVVYFLLKADKKSKRKIIKASVVILCVLAIIFNKYGVGIIPRDFAFFLNSTLGTNIPIDVAVGDDNTITIRENLQLYGLSLFLEQPILGIGFGNFIHYSGTKTTFANYTITELESSFYSTIIEGGILWSLLVLTLFVYLAYLLYRRIKEKNTANQIIVLILWFVGYQILIYGNDFIDYLFWMTFGYIYKYTKKVGLSGRKRRVKVQYDKVNKELQGIHTSR